jgi:hypothetical protein
MDEGRFKDITRPLFHSIPQLHLIYNIGVSPVSAILSPRHTIAENRLLQAVFAFVAGTDSDEYRTKFWKLSHHPLQKKFKQWIKKIRFYRKGGTPA